MKTTAHDVAAYILAERGKTSTMKLHKLLYYCQVWHLVWRDKPLFDADFEAWPAGPVLRELHRLHRKQFQVKSWQRGDKDNLSKKQRKVVDDVLRDYCPLAGYQLSRLVRCDGGPWLEARAGIESTAPCDEILDKEQIKDHFTAMLGEDSAVFVSDIEWD